VFKQVLSALGVACAGVLVVFLWLSGHAVQAESSSCPPQFQTWTGLGDIGGYAGNTNTLNATVTNPYGAPWTINLNWYIGDALGNEITSGVESITIPANSSEFVMISVPNYGSSAVLINNNQNYGGGYSQCNIA